MNYTTTTPDLVTTTDVKRLAEENAQLRNRIKELREGLEYAINAIDCPYPWFKRCALQEARRALAGLKADEITNYGRNDPAW